MKAIKKYEKIHLKRRFIFIQDFKQIMKFCLVGITNTIVYYMVYVVSLLLFRKYSILRAFDYEVSHLIGFIISVFWAFTINRKYVFQTVNEAYFVELGRFYLTYSFTGLFINSILLFLWKQIGISEFIAPFINAILVVAVNYFIAKFWVFKEDKEDSA